MAGGVKIAASNAVLDYLMAGTSAGLPANWYVALLTTMPLADGSGAVEATGGSYARLSVTRNATNFPAAASGSIQNGTAFTWSNFGATLGTVTGIALYDASTSGNLWFFAQLGSPITISSGQGFDIPVGQATFTLASKA